MDKESTVNLVEWKDAMPWFQGALGSPERCLTFSGFNLLLIIFNALKQAVLEEKASSKYYLAKKKRLSFSFLAFLFLPS